MVFDIVPIRGVYRGKDRSLLGTDLITPCTKKTYEFLLESYFDYLSYIYSTVPSKFNLLKLITFCDELKKYNISCEIIAYDMEPLKNVFGYSLEALGVDIIYDMGESLLKECTDITIQTLLNKNGLCDLDYVSNIISKLNDKKWEPCYVYRVIY